jgi:hypothetical protein
MSAPPPKGPSERHDAVATPDETVVISKAAPAQAIALVRSVLN